jgi:hypothetical protein
MSSRKTLLLALNLAAFCLLGYVAFRALSDNLVFDDAFMFWRYALHARGGLGLSWNPDGIPTGGMTSLGWFLFVLPLSFLPLGHGQALATGSLVIGVLGIAALSLQITKLSSSTRLKCFWLVFPSLTLVLAGTHFFRVNMITGMDTMLSFAVDAALCCGIWAWCDRRGNALAAMVGLLGVCAVMVRPENGMLAVVAPLLAALLLVEKGRKTEWAWSVLTFAVGLAMYLLLYRSYFHAWLPLAFHLKSQHAYRGYIGAVHWIAERELGRFLLLAIPILAFPLACVEGRGLRIAATFLTPVMLTVLYLEGVTQIMGYYARYYLPLLAPVLVAAFWMADLALQGDWRSRLRQHTRRTLAVGVVFVLLAVVSWRPIQKWSHARLMVAPYPAPVLVTPAVSSLPWHPGEALNRLLGTEVIRPMGSGSVVAATEVGLVGALAPQVAVIDLTGLNDNETAWKGFSMDRLLDRKPALIWFAHNDYTWQRRQMFCSPGLLKAYTVLGGDAFDYSLAVRRDLPESPQLMERVGLAFQQVYPGVAMQDYLVSSIDCNQ